MKTGFIIVNYNDYKTVCTLIDNIKNYKIIDTIVIVDNCSTDNSFKELQTLSNEKIVIIKNEANKGYGSGINFGAKYLIDLYNECDIIISNADIVIDSEDDLIKLKKELNKNDNIGLIAPVIKEHTGLNRGWKIPTPFIDSLLNLLFIHRFLRKKILFYKEDYLKRVVEVEAVSGCFFMMKSESLKKANFFDENVFLYYEENIISKKLQNINNKVLLDTEVSVFHNHSVTIDKSLNHIKKYKALKKSQLYFHKNYNDASWLEVLLLTITNKLSLLVLYIISILKGGFNK